MLNNGQYAPLSIRSYPGRHRPPRSYLSGVLSSYSPLHGPVSGITLLSTRYQCSIINRYFFLRPSSSHFASIRA